MRSKAVPCWEELADNRVSFSRRSVRFMELL